MQLAEKSDPSERERGIGNSYRSFRRGTAEPLETAMVRR